jgi:hypothetical protein
MHSEIPIKKGKANINPILQINNINSYEVKRFAKKKKQTTGLAQVAHAYNPSYLGG